MQAFDSASLSLSEEVVNSNAECSAKDEHDVAKDEINTVEETFAADITQAFSNKVGSIPLIRIECFLIGLS